MNRKVIIAGASAAGGLLASLVVPKARFLLGAAVGAGVAAASAVIATEPPKPPAPTLEEPTGGQAPTTSLGPITIVTPMREAKPTLPFLPKDIAVAVATSAPRPMTEAEYKRKLAQAGLNVIRRTDWAQRTRLTSSVISPYAGWLGSLVAFGAAMQTVFAQYLKDHYHNRFDGEWGKGFSGSSGGVFSMFWEEQKHHGGTDRWRDVHVEWPAPCDEMGDVKWTTFMTDPDQGYAIAGRDLNAPYQEIIQRKFVDNFLGKNKDNDEHGHWGEADFYEYQLDKRQPGGEHYDWIMSHKGRFIPPLEKGGKTHEGYMKDLKDYYQIGYWLVWAAECWRINSLPPAPTAEHAALLNPPKKWVRHCLAWGVGVASRDRMLRKWRARMNEIPLVPSGPPSISQNIEGLYYKVMQHTPIPGELPSGSELSRRSILNWPQVGEMAVFRPTWEWPGGKSEWDGYIQAARLNQYWEKREFQIAMLGMNLVSSVMSSIVGGALGEAVGMVTGALTSGAIVTAINALRSFASSGFDLSYDSLISALSAVAQGAGLPNMGMDETLRWVDDQIKEIETYWGYAEDLLGDVDVLPDLQRQYEDDLKRLGV